MYAIMDCYFDDVFSKLDRGYLLARYKRKELVDYFSMVIQGCYRGHEQPSTDKACDRAVQSAVRFHSSTRGGNGDICLMGKYHNVLYIAARLAFDWKLSNTSTVCSLLDGMYFCEGSFERLFTGAIIGTKASHIISGWKSDFDNSDQNLQAIVYFTHHSVLGKRLYSGKRFVDVPMESYGRNTPAGLCVQVSNPQVLLVLLRFGARLNPTGDARSNAALQVVLRLNDYYNRGAKPPPGLLQCLTLALRAVASIPLHAADDDPFISDLSEKLKEVIPANRNGQVPPELKHLSRVAVRESLAENHQLPYGIDDLELPESLRKYLNLECD